MSRLYIFNSKIENVISLIILFLTSIFSFFLIAKFIYTPDVRVKFLGFSILTLGAIMPLYTLRTSQQLRIKISMSILGIVLALYSFEYYLEIKEKLIDETNHKSHSKTKLALQEYDSNSKPSVAIAPLSLVNILSGNSNGGAKAKNGEMVPLSNVSNKRTILFEDENGPVTFQSDRYGFNNEDQIWEKPIDIAFIGDSFTEGVGANKKNNIVSKVIDKHPQTINIGIVGLGPLAMLGSIHEYLTKAKPKLVIWCYVSNDLYPNLALEKGNSILVKYLDSNFNQDLINRQDEVDELINQYLAPKGLTSTNTENKSKVESSLSFSDKIKQFANSKFAKLYRTRQKVLRPYLAQLNADTAFFGEIIKAANETTKSWGGKIIFVYLPTPERFYKNQLDPFKKEIFQIVNRNEIQIVDLEDVFLEEKDPKHLFKNVHSHYNEKGYALASEAILKAIEQSNAK